MSIIQQNKLSNWANIRIIDILKTPEMYGKSLETIELQLLTLFEIRCFSFEKNFSSQDYFKIVQSKYKKFGTICNILEDNFNRMNEFVFMMKIMNDEIIKWLEKEIAESQGNK